MKLTKMEMIALEHQIINNLKELAYKEQLLLDKQSAKANLLLAKKMFSELNRLSPQTKTFLKNHGRHNILSYTVEALAETLRQKQTKITVPDYRENTIFHKIVLTQVDCPDLQSLIDKVTKTFIA